MPKCLKQWPSAEKIEEPTINLTPLIDVVFVILIMFIIIAPLLELDRIDLADASKDSFDSTITVQEVSPIAIHVHSDNSLWYNKRQVSLIELTALLKEAKMQYPSIKP